MFNVYIHDMQERQIPTSLDRLIDRQIDRETDRQFKYGLKGLVADLEEGNKDQLQQLKV